MSGSNKATNWEIVTNGSSYRLMDSITKKFYREDRDVNFIYATARVRNIWETKDLEEARKKRQELTWRLVY